MENCLCNDVMIKALREALTNLFRTTGVVMNTNTMSLPESGIGSIQSFNTPNSNSSYSNHFSNLNLVIISMSLLLIVSLLVNRVKNKSTYK